MSKLSQLRRRMQRNGSGPVANVKPRRITIATPMMDMCHTAFCVSLVGLVARTMMEMKNVELNFLQFGTSILPMGRQLLAVQALENQSTHMLWIDSDMEFPTDLLIRLAAHDLPIVAANCIARRPPYAYTARYPNGEQVPTTMSSSGIEKVERIGFGVVYHSTDVLRAIPLPWFEFKWLPEKMIFAGEDFSFCDGARKAGFELYIDHDVSKEIKHVGVFGYSPLYKAVKEAAQRVVTEENAQPPSAAGGVQ